MLWLLQTLLHMHPMAYDNTSVPTSAWGPAMEVEQEKEARDRPSSEGSTLKAQRVVV
jgi:hypothetical protein